jgi:hypothetical protein
MDPSSAYALFYEHHPTREFVMVTVHAPNRIDSVFEGRRELHALMGTDYRPANFTLVRAFEVPR